ncbi:hypothetical protein QN277_026569 [Acacia crassicarpa]|uniref:Uncharacterized protein n=1 Tax=Acacia crassicarpa TaxID=499986 RepID=A0AAE1MHI3_9FABA|nr:hypothetical protein QN277_026569 [Acacia crassicarpa]
MEMISITKTSLWPSQRIWILSAPTQYSFQSLLISDLVLELCL